MSSKYALWLNYDNDKKKYQIPQNPEEISVEVNGKVTTSDIDKIGTLLHKGKRDALVVSWSGFFPAYFGSFCACSSKNFKKPDVMHKWVLSLMQASDPVHLVLSGGPLALDIFAVVTSYSAKEVGGDPGTLQYSIQLKEYRSVTITEYKTSTTNTTTPTTTSTTRVNNEVKSKTYTIKSGDCLWNIAKKYYGDGSKESKIYNANKTVIEKAAKAHGFSSSNNGNRIWPGTVLTIP